MKHLNVIMAAMVLMASGCESEKIESVTQQEVTDQMKVPVTVGVSGFSFDMEDFSMTRGAAVADYSGVQAVTLAFYDGETEVYKTTQLKESMPEGATFGHFRLDLPLGSYTMVMLGYVLYDDDELTLTSPTQAEYTGGSPRETFAATQAVNITNTSSVELNAMLERIVAQLKVISSDKRTDNVEKVRMTFMEGGKRFSPTSGLATLNKGFCNTVGISTAVGARSGSISNIFLASDEQEMNVTIETLDAEGNTVFSTVVEDVPFKRNRITKLTGSIYPTAASVGSSFSVSTDWLPAHEMTF